jgi:hypothetical protein
MTTPIGGQPAPQLSEATFRTYEPFIHRAVKAWPEETRFAPTDMVNEKSGRPLSPNTFAARMRDSVVSLHRFGWTTYIDIEKFRTMFGTFSVAFDSDGSVWFRNRGRRGRPLVFAGERVDPSLPTTASASPTWPDGWTIEEVEAVCRLIHHARVNGPITLTGILLDEHVHSLMSTFNVGIHVDANNNRTIIT